MLKDEKISSADNKDDQRDILGRLRNKDILNYIKEIQQNCHLQVSSDNEDYADTKRSSNGSLGFSGRRVRLSKRVRSKVTSRRNKNVVSLKKKIQKRSSGCNAMNVRLYCSSSRDCRIHNCTIDPSIRENSKRNLSAPVKSVYQHPKLSGKRDFSDRHNGGPSPKFHDWYSRKNHKIHPAVSEITSIEMIKNGSQDTITNFRINRSRIGEKRFTKDHVFKSMRKSDDTLCTSNNYRNFAFNERSKGRSTSCIDRQGLESKHTKEIKEGNDNVISDYVNRQYSGNNKSYRNRNIIDEATTRTSLKNQDHKERDVYSGYSYSVKKCAQSTYQAVNSPFNKLTISEKFPPLLWQNEVRDKNYHQTHEIRHNNNNYNNNNYYYLNRRRRKPDVLGEKGSPCYRKSTDLRESRKPYKVACTRENKQPLDCSCEKSVEWNEMADDKYYHYPENVNDSTQPNYPTQRTCRTIRTGKRENHRKSGKTIHLTSSRLVHTNRNKNKNKSDFNILTKGNLHKNIVYIDNNCTSDDDASDGDSAISYNDKIRLKDLRTHVTLSNDWMDNTGRLNKIACEHEKLNGNLKTSHREATEISREKLLRERITRGYSTVKEFPLEVKKLLPENSSELEHDVVQPTCKCKQPFRELSASRLTDAYDCIRNNENIKGDSTDDSSQGVSICCCCSLISSHDENDPVKKLESFCERVKAVNQNTSDNQFDHTWCENLTGGNTIRRYPCCGDSDRSDVDIQTPNHVKITKSSQRERLAYSNAPSRLAKPTCNRGKRRNLEKILIYPPRGETGPPLTLYKKWSNVNCQVKGDANMGFRYNVTYIQKFISPMWMPSLSTEKKEETTEECNCSSEYG